MPKTIELYRDEVSVLQTVPIPNEQPQAFIPFTPNQLVTFLRNFPRLSDPLPIIAFLESYTSIYQILILEFPWFNRSPSIKILVPSTIGTSVRLDLQVDFAAEFMDFLNRPDIASGEGTQE